MDQTNTAAWQRAILENVKWDWVIDWERQVQVSVLALSLILRLFTMCSDVCPFVIICHQQQQQLVTAPQQHNNNLRPEKYLTQSGGQAAKCQRYKGLS